jgi:hypothetical protein
MAAVVQNNICTVSVGVCWRTWGNTLVTFNYSGRVSQNHATLHLHTNAQSLPRRGSEAASLPASPPVSSSSPPCHAALTYFHTLHWITVQGDQADAATDSPVTSASRGTANPLRSSVNAAVMRKASVSGLEELS